MNLQTSLDFVDAKMIFLHKDSEVEIGNIFTKTNAISKWKRWQCPIGAKWRYFQMALKWFKILIIFSKSSLHLVSVTSK